MKNKNHAQVAEKKSESDFEPYTCVWEFIPLRFERAIKQVATVRRGLAHKINVDVRVVKTIQN